jgi:hypothetical protein
VSQLRRRRIPALGASLVDGKPDLCRHGRPSSIVRRALIPPLVAAMLLLGVSLQSAHAAAGSHWTVEQTTNVFQPQLDAIDCTSPNACTAVGQSGRVGLVERWNGSVWSQVPVPGSAGPLHAISCASSNSCMAVGANRCGGPVAERWDGKTWKDSPLRLSATINQCASVFNGVSCTSARFCLAAGAPNALESWNGERWSIKRARTVMNSGFNSVSCATSKACAVGGGWGSGGGGGRLLEFWDGRHFSMTLRHDDNGRVAASVNGISCPSKAMCLSVAGDADGFAFADSWNGRSWRNIPVDSSPIGGLTGVSCTSSRSCVVVGSGGYPSPATVESWNGEVLRPMLNDLMSTFSGLSGISCLQQTACTIVGTGVAGLPLAARHF